MIFLGSYHNVNDISRNCFDTGTKFTVEYYFNFKMPMNNTNHIKLSDSVASSVAHKLSVLMKERNVSELEIARSLNTSVMTIRRVISGETEDPRISTLKLIASYFNVSVDFLLDDNQISTSNMMQKKIPKFVPILDWDVLKRIESIYNVDYSKCEKWHPVVTNGNLEISNHAYALESRPSMQPRFPSGTLFIINPNETPIDGDLILIKMKDTNELSLRELAIDTPKWQFQPIISGSETLFYDDKLYEIVGVVILTVLQNRK